MIDLGDETLTLRFDGKDARVKWGAIATVQLVAPGKVAPEYDPSAAPPTGTPPLRPVVDITGVAEPAGPAATPTAIPTATPIPEPAAPVRERESEPQFGDVYTMELGGTLDFFAGSAEVENGIDTVSASGHTIDARPFLGFFLLPGWEVMAEVVLTSTATNYHQGGDDWTTYTGFRAGTAYFFRRPSGVAFGPQVLFGGYSMGSETQDASGMSFDYEERGVTTSGLLAVRVPIGESALLAMGFGFYRDTYGFDYYPGGLGSKGSGRRSGFESTIGLSMWIPR